MRAMISRTAVWAVGVLVLVLAACESGSAKPEAGPLPAEFQAGETKFKANCAACHGERGVGTDHGPPLVHKIYEPNHHGDQTFLMAAANGVRAHHWNFGNMPKIEAATPSDVTDMIAYVRWLQRQAGIQ